MKRALAALVAMLCAAPAAAAPTSPPATLPGDARVVVTLDGRPLSRDRDHVAGFRRGAVVYGAISDLVQAYDGLLIYKGSGVTVTIRGETARFVAGSRTALIQDVDIPMPGRTLRRADELYVPLNFFVTRVANGAVLQSRDGSRADIIAPH